VVHAYPERKTMLWLIRFISTATLSVGGLLLLTKVANGATDPISYVYFILYSLLILEVVVVHSDWGAKIINKWESRNK